MPTRALSTFRVSEASTAEIRGAVARATGLSEHDVATRLRRAHAEETLGTLFGPTWRTPERLGALTLGFVTRWGLREDVAAVAGLAPRTVGGRIGAAPPNQLVRNTFEWPPSGPPATTPTKVPPATTGGKTKAPPATTARPAGAASKRGGSPPAATKPAASGPTARGRTTMPLAATTATPSTAAAPPRPTTRPARPSATTPTRTLLTGTVVSGRWKVVRHLGGGGFGHAYEVEDIKHPGHTPRVLKFAIGGIARKHLVDEMRVAMDLTHQNLCKYLHVDEDPAHGVYLVMEHGGTSLDGRVSGGPTDLKVAIDLVAQAAAGLDFAHDERVLHLDVKPGNLLVAKSTRGVLRLRVSDFGIAVAGKHVEFADHSTVVASIAPGFSPGYAAPEQRLGREVTRRSDQYSLARVFVALLKGRQLDGGYLPGALPMLNAAQNRAVARALNDAPTRRFDSCSAFVNALMAK